MSLNGANDETPLLTENKKSQKFNIFDWINFIHYYQEQPLKTSNKLLVISTYFLALLLFLGIFYYFYQLPSESKFGKLNQIQQYGEPLLIGSIILNDECILQRNARLAMDGFFYAPKIDECDSFFTRIFPLIMNTSGEFIEINGNYFLGNDIHSYAFDINFVDNLSSFFFKKDEMYFSLERSFNTTALLEKYPDFNTSTIALYWDPTGQCLATNESFEAHFNCSNRTIEIFF